MSQEVEIRIQGYVFVAKFFSLVTSVKGDVCPDKDLSLEGVVSYNGGLILLRTDHKLTFSDDFESDVPKCVYESGGTVNFSYGTFLFLSVGKITWNFNYFHPDTGAYEEWSGSEWDFSLSFGFGGGSINFRVVPRKR